MAVLTRLARAEGRPAGARLVLVLVLVLVPSCTRAARGAQRAFVTSWIPARACKLSACAADRRTPPVGVATALVPTTPLMRHVANSTLAEEAEDLRREALENAGQAAIDRLDDPVTQGATRVASELASRLDDTVLAAANKGASVVEKASPSLQGVAAKVQGVDFSGVFSSSSKHADLASGLLGNVASVLSQEHISQLLVDAPLQFSQFAAPLIAGGGWEFAIAALR